MEMTNERPTSTAKPMAVTWAVRLMLISLGLSWIKAAFMVTRFPTGSKTVLVLVLIGGVAVTLFLLAQLAKGQSFVRWLFLVAFLIGLPAMLPLYRSELQQAPWLFCLERFAIAFTGARCAATVPRA
ncbi:MAG: hypothetical protein HYR56_34515 [Acidobacteria bacterium]|nr:hypothetical protein [Acidobacteriota bacterium]MBI3423668.1 hypothetical protein [Acidobacteriota bacterium]